MNTRVYIFILISMFFGASLVSAAVLHGIPGGDLSDPNFAGGVPSQSFPGQGHWSYSQSWANATATIVGTGDARHAELWTEWYTRSAGIWYMDDGKTPLDTPWRISADLKLHTDGSNKIAANKWFILTNDHSGVWEFFMDFSGGVDSNGLYAINWTAGSKSGTYYSATSIIDNYVNASFEYDPTTGFVTGVVGSETIFSETIATGMSISTVFFAKSQLAYADDGTFYFDNVHAGPIPTIPTVQVWEPGLNNGEVYTGSTGLNVVRVGWSEPVSFVSSNILITNKDGSSVPFSVSGSGSAIMTITLGQILFKDKYTITVLDSVKSVSAGVAIDGNDDGLAGGNKVFVVEHRMRSDNNGDNQVNFTDFSNFAVDWLWQK